MRNAFVIEVKDKEYTLEFDRTTIIYTEEVVKFSINGYGESPFTQMYKLFSGALFKNHPDLSVKQSMDLFDDYANEGGDIEALNGALLESYTGFIPTTQVPTKTFKKL